MQYNWSVLYNDYIVPVKNPQKRRKKWCVSPGVTANVNRGQYHPSTPVHADLGVPKWPELSMEQILKIAFKNRHITDLNHPVLRNLRGER